MVVDNAIKACLADSRNDLIGEPSFTADQPILIEVVNAILRI